MYENIWFTKYSTKLPVPYNNNGCFTVLLSAYTLLIFTIFLIHLQQTQLHNWTCENNCTCIHFFFPLSSRTCSYGRCRLHLGGTDQTVSSSHDLNNSGKWPRSSWIIFIRYQDNIAYSEISFPHIPLFTL